MAPVQPENSQTQQQVSREEAQKLEIATESIMQSLNILPQGSSQEPPRADGSSQSVSEPQQPQEGSVEATEPVGEGAHISEEQLARQVDQSLQEIQKTKETLERLG